MSQRQSLSVVQLNLGLVQQGYDVQVAVVLRRGPVVAGGIAAQERRHTGVGVIGGNRAVAGFEVAPGTRVLLLPVGDGFHRVEVGLDADQPQLLLQEGGAGGHLGVRLDSEQVGPLKVEAFLFQDGLCFGPGRFQVIGDTPAGHRAELFHGQFPGAAGSVAKSSPGAVTVLEYLNTGISVNGHYHGLPDPDIVKGFVAVIDPQAEVAAGGPDYGDNLVVVHVGLVLAPVSDPVPVGLVGQLGGLLGGLIQDSEDDQFIHVGQFGNEVVVVSLEVLLVVSDCLTFHPLEGADSQGGVLEHGLLAAGLEPGLVEYHGPAVGQVEERNAGRTVEVHLQRHIVDAFHFFQYDVGQAALHVAGGQAVSGAHYLKSESGVFADEGLAIVPVGVFPEVEGHAVQPFVNVPVAGQVGDHRGAGIVGILLD